MKDLRKNTVIAIFGALVAVLQIIATFISFGSFPITLTLIPIIIAGAIYGPGIGALMGLIFGVIVAPVLHFYFDLFSGAMQAYIFVILTISFIGKELPNKQGEE